MDEHLPIEQLIHAGREIAARGWVLGRGGNLSARVGELVYVTARGTFLNALTPSDFVPIHVATETPLNAGKPTSELPMHLAAYRARADATCVLHMHPRHVIACGLVGLSIPAFTPDFFIHLGDEVPLVPYFLPGGNALAGAIAGALAKNHAVLLQNHGLLVVGSSVEQAFLRAELVEEAARILLLAEQTQRPIRVLSEADRAELRDIKYASSK